MLSADFQSDAAYLHVDRRGHPLIEDGINQPSGLEEGSKLGKLDADFPPHFVHVFETADVVILVQADLNEGRVHCGVGGSQGREIGHHADIGDHRIQVARRTTRRTMSSTCLT